MTDDRDLDRLLRDAFAVDDDRARAIAHAALERSPRRRRWALAATAVVAIGGLGWLVGTGGDAEPPTIDPPTARLDDAAPTHHVIVINHADRPPEGQRIVISRRNP